MALTIVGIGACAGDQPTEPDTSILAAKGGGGIQITGADPNNAPQDTRLDVRVSGSGFEPGFVVTLLLAGKSTPKVITNSTRFEEGDLIADITIAADADIAFYDIEVTPPRGRPGVGSELFSVKKKGDTEPQFSITTTDLGTLGSSWTGANSVVSGPDGNSVRVVGKSGDLAFYWTPGGGMLELTTGPAEQDESILDAAAVDINDWGQIVGQRWVDRGDLNLNGAQPLFWSSSQPDAIVLPMRLARSSYSTAINENGQVVGQSYDHSDDPDAPHAHAMLWTVNGDGTVTTRDLHEEWFGNNGFINSQTEDINDDGRVVGRAWDGFQERAYLFWDDDRGVTFLAGLEAGFFSIAFAISNADPVQIIGAAHDQADGSPRALLWTVLADGTVLTEELPPLAGFEWSQALDLNDFGEVVGYSRPTNTQQDDHATLWTFDPQTGDRIAVDLGQGWPQAIDNSASLVGLTRVVGSTRVLVGKGRKKTRTNHAILWEVAPIIP